MRSFLHLALFVMVASKPLVAGVITEENFQNAAEYSRVHGGLGLRVQEAGRVVFQDYYPGDNEETPHKIYSGTKSFVSYAIWEATMRDHLFTSLDEPACDYLWEWARDRRRTITLRELLTQTAGLDTGNDQVYPSRDQVSAAVHVPQIHPPGVHFLYGPSNYQALGEILRRRLRGSGMDLETYITTRALNPAGVEAADWKHDPSGMPMLHTGLMLSARQWAKYGEFLKRHLLEIQPMLHGTAANPAYGMGFWLNIPEPHVSLEKMRELQVAVDGDQIYAGGPSDLFAAIGAGKQRLYVIPSLNVVIVRFGNGQRFSDGDFLSRLITGQPNPDRRTHE